MSNGEIQMRSAKGSIRRYVMDYIRKGAEDDFILAGLCHQKGLKIGNAKLHLKKAKAQHAEETRTKVVKSLMSGKEVEILASTPLACDPSKETYWSM
jgi:hypothetical protein